MSTLPLPRSAADRNLLFGILALQLDFVSQEALIAAMHAWVLNKAKPLGEILHEQCQLSAARLQLLDTLVAEHLQVHGHDAERSLAALPARADVRAELKRLADPDVQASLAYVGPPTPSADGGGGPATTDYRAAAGLRFERLRPHARGGLGEVFVARDTELNREVALKEIQERHADSTESRARFVREAQVTGGLEHPGIVPVYGLGTYGDGRPFYAMRFIKGESLKDAIARFHRTSESRERQRPGEPSPVADAPDSPTMHNLAFRQLLTRFIATCNAIAYAHSRGVLHRDLKPANIMLGDYGETLIVDWGLARTMGEATDPHVTTATAEAPLRLLATGDSDLTRTGQALGTPAYMSPEQAAGRLDHLGPASDVYSLGATLYCLLTGQAPITESDVGEGLRKTQKGDFPPPRQREPEVPRALEAICLKAMALRPGERYPSAKALADDLEHWLADEAVTAYREPLTARLGRWRRRHKGLVGTVVAVGVATAAVAVAVVLISTARERETTEKNLREIAENERTEAQNQRAETAKQRDLGRRYLYLSHMQMADRAWQEARVDLMEDLLHEQRPERIGNEDLRGFEWHYLWRLRHDSLFTFRGHGAAFSPDGRRLATVLDDGSIKLWDAGTGHEIASLGANTGSAGRIWFSPDGRRLATIGRNFTVQIWDPNTGQQTLAVKGNALAFSPDGRLVAVAAERVKLLDVRTGQAVVAMQGGAGAGETLAFSPDGQHLAGGNTQGRVFVWDTKTGLEALTIKAHVFPVTMVAFSPDGQRLASASSDGTVQVRDTRTGRVQLSLPPNSRQVLCVTFSPDGRLLATGGFDRMVKLWDAQTGQEVLTFRGHAGTVYQVAFSPDSQRLASAGSDGMVRVWDSRPGQDIFVQENDWINDVAFSPDGKRLATVSRSRMARLWDARTGQEILTFQGHTNAVQTVAFSPDGQRLASGGYDNVVRVWDARTGQELLTFRGHTKAVEGVKYAAVTSVAFSPDGRRVASSGLDNTVRVWEAQSGHEMLVFKGHAEWEAPGQRSWVTRVVFAPDGQRLASVGRDGIVKVWNARTAREELSVKGHGVVFSRDGQRLATPLAGGPIVIWDAATGQELLVLKGHVDTVTTLSFSPDSERLVSGSIHVVKIWDLRTGQQALTLPHPGNVTGLAFSPDGQRLVSAGHTGQVRVWDARPITEQSLREARAISCFRFLAQRLVLREAILENLRQDQTLSEPVRQQALLFAESYKDSTDRLNAASWSVVRSPRFLPADYRVALLQAEAACRREPDNGSLLNTLGAAKYRVGQYDAALKTLTQSDKLNAIRFRGSLPADLAFLAQTHHQLGHKEQAAAQLALLREVMTKPQWSTDEEAKSLLREAETLLTGRLKPIDRD